MPAQKKNVFANQIRKSFHHSIQEALNPEPCTRGHQQRIMVLFCVYYIKPGEGRYKHSEVISVLKSLSTTRQKPFQRPGCQLSRPRSYFRGGSQPSSGTPSQIWGLEFSDVFKECGFRNFRHLGSGVKLRKHIRHVAHGWAPRVCLCITSTPSLSLSRSLSVCLYIYIYIYICMYVNGCSRVSFL